MDCAKDEATLFVLRGSASKETPAEVSLPSFGRTPAPALAASKPGASALPDDLAAWLSGLSLSAYAEPLGLVSLADVELMDEDDLKEAGLKPAERKRFLAAKSQLAK